MKSTHQFKDMPHDDVTAWQHGQGSSMPVWVARNFHDLGSGTLTHRGGQKVNRGDWIVLIDDRVAIVLTAQEFDQCFRALPNNEERGTNEHRANLHPPGAS